MPTSLDRARPGTAAVAASRPRRAVVALGLVAALTGGGLVAQASEASAAPASATVHTAKPQPHTAFTVSKRTIKQGAGAAKRPVYKVAVKRSGDAVSGRAKLVINGKVVANNKLKHGKSSFKPSWKKYKAGKNRVRVYVDPSSSMLRGVSTRTLPVKAKKKANRGAKIVAVANAQVGDRYVYGASGPSAFDCSGFTSYVYKKAVGKSLSRSSSAQRTQGRQVSRSNAKPGDLIWTPGHVAIYIGKGKQIEAARPGVGVVKRHIWQDSPRFIRI
jgi:cell wall-associated NlpC family hydrolase